VVWLNLYGEVGVVEGIFVELEGEVVEGEVGVED